MKQSVDLMNSMKLMNSRHSNTTTTTSLARRALLLLSFLVMSVGSAWGQTEFVYNIKLTDQTQLSFNLASYLNAVVLSKLGDSGLSSVDDLKTSSYVRWSLEKTDGTVYTALYGPDGSMATNTHLYSVGSANNAYPYQLKNDNLMWISTASANFEFKDDSKFPNLINVSLYARTGKTILEEVEEGYYNKLVCYLTTKTDGVNQWSLSAEPAIQVKINLQPYCA